MIAAESKVVRRPPLSATGANTFPSGAANMKQNFRLWPQRLSPSLRRKQHKTANGMMAVAWSANGLPALKIAADRLPHLDADPYNRLALQNGAVGGRQAALNPICRLRLTTR